MGSICCNLTQRLLTGIIPGEVDPPTPPGPMHIFSTGVNLSGLGDTISIGGVSSGISNFDGPTLATFIKTEYNTNSGAGLQNGDATYGMWIMAETAPTDWTWNGVAITWNDLGLAEQKCYNLTDGTFADINNWAMYVLFVGDLSFTTQGAAPQYLDPSLQDYLNIFIPQVCGDGVTSSVSTSGNDVTLTIFNSYIPISALTSFDGNNFQPGTFAESVCP